MQKVKLKRNAIVEALSVRNTYEEYQIAPKKQRGITLIALIITIIVMLILVGVTINVAMNGGLFGKANKAATDTQIAAEKESLQAAAIGAYDEEKGEVDFSALDSNLPNGFTGSEGTYTSSKSNKEYSVNKKTAQVTESSKSTETKKIVTAEDEEYNYWKTDGEGTILYYNVPDGVEVPETVIVPCQVGDEKIIAIGQYALSGLKIEIDETTGNPVFDNYSNLTIIDEIPFSDPDDIYAPKENTGKLRGIKKVIVSEGIEYIMDSFKQSLYLEEVVLPSTVKDIGSYRACKSLKSINIPEGVTEINSYCFTACTSLQEITIPSTVNMVYNNAFSKWLPSQTIYVKGKTKEESNWGDRWYEEWNNPPTIVWDA